MRETNESLRSDTFIFCTEFLSDFRAVWVSLVKSGTSESAFRSFAPTAAFRYYYSSCHTESSRKEILQIQEWQSQTHLSANPILFLHVDSHHFVSWHITQRISTFYIFVWLWVSEWVREKERERERERERFYKCK